MKQGIRSELIEFDGLRFAPENELGVVLLFGKIHRKLGFPEIDIIKPGFPDCWAYQRIQNGTKKIWIEFEFRSKSFKNHIEKINKLKPKKGIVVCWEHNGLSIEKYANVIELKTAVGFGKRVWTQCINPEYQNIIDSVSSKKKDEWWSVCQSARPNDLVLIYRSGTKTEAKRKNVDESLLQSIANIFEVTSMPYKDKKGDWKASLRQLAILNEPLRLEHLKEDIYLKNCGWVKANLQGRRDVTPQWWRLRQLILKMNPELRKNKRFLQLFNVSIKNL